MTEAEAIDFARESIWVLLMLAAPGMLTALVVGVAIGLLQALTQVQEMTLDFVRKILAIFLVMLIALPFAGSAMATYMDNVVARIAQP
jgi:flagellar biosynthetic protein FliQ